MKKTTRNLLIAATVLLVISFLAGCDVENPTNPAPAGEYLGVEQISRVAVQEKAKYSWRIGDISHEAVPSAETEYFIDNVPVDSEGALLYAEKEDTNLFWDDTYDIVVEPAGIIARMNLNLGE